MNARERVLAAINHKEPDRLAVDLGATPSSGISAIAYSNLKKYLDLTKGYTRIYDVVQQLAQPENEILDRFGIDVVDIGRMFNTEDLDWYDIKMSNGAEAQYPTWFKPRLADDGSWNAYSDDGTAIAKMPKDSTYFDQTYYPFLEGYPENFKKLSEAMGKVLWAAMVHSPWDNIHLPDFWQQLREKTLKLRQQTDRALVVVCGCNLFEWGTMVRRIDNFLMDLLMDQKNVEALLDALLEIHLDTLEKVCQAVGDVVDILRFGDDLGMDSGPFMEPELYQKLFKPRHKQLCDYVKKNSQMHTFLHSCGSIYKLIPDLIEAGFEILNPVQTNCKDMEPERLKKEFGKDITFWGGGADTRYVLNTGSPDEVKEHVKRRLDIFSPGGGFVFNTVHNILPDIPPENIVAMFEAVDEFNR
jgi:uroporphyrinogen decarboxylase